MRLNSLVQKDIKNRPDFLPFELSFCDYNMKNLNKIHEVFLFLNHNYIQDSKNYFRFSYNHEFIKKMLTPPDWNPFNNLVIGFYRNRKILGSVHSINRKIFYRRFFQPMSEINFLCVSKKLRKRKLVTVLIKEISRRQNLIGFTEAVFTTGLAFGDFVAKAKIFHLYLKKKKLVKFGFIESRGFHSEDNVFFNFLKKENLSNNECLRRLCKKFFFSKLYSFLNENEFTHLFFTIPGVFYKIISWKQNNSDTPGFTSFFCLPTKFIKEKKKIFLFSAYFFYDSFTYDELFHFFTCIILAKKLGFDLLNLVSLKFEKIILNFMGFVIGSGVLQYHFTNLKFNKIRKYQNSLMFF